MLPRTLFGAYVFAHPSKTRYPSHAGFLAPTATQSADGWSHHVHVADAMYCTSAPPRSIWGTGFYSHTVNYQDDDARDLSILDLQLFFSRIFRKSKSIAMTKISATWTKLASSARLQRSSQCLSVLDSRAWIFGGELLPRQPVDSQLDVVKLDVAQGTYTVAAIYGLPAFLYILLLT